MTTANPLAWPKGWPRTPAPRRQDSRFKFRRPSGPWTFSGARDALTKELELMGARSIVLSSNFELRLDGLPRAASRVPDDTGIAVYFVWRGEPKVMACDAHLRAEENMRSIALALAAMRQLERHGGGTMMTRAFAGFAALPAPNAENRAPWRRVLGLESTARPTHDDIEQAFLQRARKAHPDVGGSAETMAALNEARRMALAELGGQA